METKATLKVMSYNIHKGFAKKKLSIQSIKNEILNNDPDIVFLQEVQGENKKHEVHKKYKQNWPLLSQHDFLGEDVWVNRIYGKNAVYEHGHHGNAILSKYPIIKSFNYNVSTSKLEQRGILHVVIDLPYRKEHLHVFCVHLSLNGKGRIWQLKELKKIIENNVPSECPVIIGGDFNDWFNYAKKYLIKGTELIEVFKQCNVCSRSFPSKFPLLSLDRFYVRGLNIVSGGVLRGLEHLSDHSPIMAILR